MQRWDVFCRVVDNFGDVGTCWRLARQLAEEHSLAVRLWVDDLRSFARLCPSLSTESAFQYIDSIEVGHWRPDFPDVEPAAVVIEAFACELPPTYVAAMARQAVPPVWINLEYLSAETWVADCHALPSPHPTLPLIKFFFFPGFTPRTGGLLREQDLLAARAAFDTQAAAAFWTSLGMAPPAAEELSVSLFCYANPALTALLEEWSVGSGNVRLLATPGAATEQVSRWLQTTLTPGMKVSRDGLTVHAIPFLSQPDYDRLLWSCDVNFARGEDSFVRAQWAQQPFAWQIYPQSDGAHWVKLDAFLCRYLADADGAVALTVRRFFEAWNGRGEIVSAWRELSAIRQSVQEHGRRWAGQLDRMGDLTNNLRQFVEHV